MQLSGPQGVKFTIFLAILFCLLQNDLAELERLIDKWRGVCQEALLTLQNKMPEPTPHLTDLINNLNLDVHILRYNVEDEDFDS